VAFGAMPSVSDLRLSPDGKSLSYIGPNKHGDVVFVYDLGAHHAPVAALVSSGSPDRLSGCSWVSNSRLVCEVSVSVKSAEYGVMPYTRMVAADRNGGQLKVLSKESNGYTRGYNL